MRTHTCSLCMQTRTGAHTTNNVCSSEPDHCPRTTYMQTHRSEEVFAKSQTNELHWGTSVLFLKSDQFDLDKVTQKQSWIAPAAAVSETRWHSLLCLPAGVWQRPRGGSASLRRPGAGFMGCRRNAETGVFIFQVLQRLFPVEYPAVGVTLSGTNWLPHRCRVWLGLLSSKKYFLL